MTQYIGRFAPSPTGPLHFGSLITALASYLDAKANNGLWLVRMEDIDPPREQQGAAQEILNTLLTHGFSWDGEVLFQSSRLHNYRKTVHKLIKNKLAYACTCSRQQLKNHNIYSLACRDKQIPLCAKAAIRIKTQNIVVTFNDCIQGVQTDQMNQDVGDFVIFRKDGCTAYQLAVALDDRFQNITHIVRGSDLLDSTTRQIYILQQLGLEAPSYSHVPIVVNQEGQKLSKQTYAKALSPTQNSQNLFHALTALGQSPEHSLLPMPVSSILDWAVSHWNSDKVPRTASIAESKIYQ